jgi:hypothetical protein
MRGESARNAATGIFRNARPGEVYFTAAAAGGVFVLGIVIETPATRFTDEMRDARALGLGSGASTHVARITAMAAISALTPQCIALSFINRISNDC